MSKKNIYSAKLSCDDEVISKTIVMFESSSKKLRGVFHIVKKDPLTVNPVVTLAENYIVDAIGSPKMDDFFTGMVKAERIAKTVSTVSLEVEEIITEADCFCQVLKDSGVLN